MHRHVNAALLALLSVAMCGTAAGQTASRSAIGLMSGSHSSSYDDTGFFGGDYFTHEFNHEEGYSYGDAGASGTGVSGGSAFAQIGYGWMRLSATTTSLSGGNQPGHYNAGEAQITFTGKFTDVITISDPLLTGQMGTVQMSALLSGVLSPSVESSLGAADQATGTAQAQISARFVQFTGANTSPNALPIVLDDVDIGGDIGFVYGTPFPITVEVTLQGRVASASNGGLFASAVSVADFTRTLSWGGMSNVRDANGNPVASYTVASLSGTDYRDAIAPPPLAIPEPATVSLCLACVVAAGAMRWRSRRARGVNGRP